EIRHQLTGWLRHQLNIRRDVQLGLNQGSDYVEQLTANYAAEWRMTRNLSLAANVAYEHGLQPLPQGTSTAIEHFDRYGAGAWLAFQITRKLGASPSYQYWLRLSDIADRDYTDNTISLTLGYNF